MDLAGVSIGRTTACVMVVDTTTSTSQAAKKYRDAGKCDDDTARTQRQRFYYQRHLSLPCAHVLGAAPAPQPEFARTNQRRWRGAQLLRYNAGDAQDGLNFKGCRDGRITNGDDDGWRRCDDRSGGRQQPAVDRRRRHHWPPGAGVDHRRNRLFHRREFGRLALSPVAPRSLAYRFAGGGALAAA